MIDGGTIIAAVTATIGVSSGAIVLYVRSTNTELQKEMGQLENRLIKQMDETYVRVGECTLRDSGTREMLKITTEEGRTACAESVNRDVETQRRINMLISEIATRTAEAIIRDERVMEKLNEILLVANKR